MSILTKPNQNNQPTVNMVAERIKKSAAQTAEQMFFGWSQTFQLLWRSGGLFAPAEKLAALGTEAGELFDLNGSMVAFMITNLTGKRDDIVEEIQNLVASMPPLTVNEDGTVTIND